MLLASKSGGVLLFSLSRGGLFFGLGAGWLCLLVGVLFARSRVFFFGASRGGWLRRIYFETEGGVVSCCTRREFELNWNEAKVDAWTALIIQRRESPGAKIFGVWLTFALCSLLLKARWWGGVGDHGRDRAGKQASVGVAAFFLLFSFLVCGSWFVVAEGIESFSTFVLVVFASLWLVGDS